MDETDDQRRAREREEKIKAKQLRLTEILHRELAKSEENEVQQKSAAAAGSSVTTQKNSVTPTSVTAAATTTSSLGAAQQAPSSTSKASVVNHHLSNPPTRQVASLSIDTTARKRSLDAASNESSRRGSLANSPEVLSPTGAGRSPAALASIQPIRKKSRVSSTVTSPTILSDTNSPITDLPMWYINAKAPQNPKSGERQLWDRLGRIGEYINNCKKAKHNKRALAAEMEKVSEELHFLEFQLVTPYALRKQRLLHNDKGLPQIFNLEFSEGVEYPWYVKADAEELYNKWQNLVFDPNLFRGIKNMHKSKEKTGQGPSIDPDHKTPWQYFGAGSLIPGQWWPSQLCAVRDGAHGSAQGGISGIPGKGATSIALSGSQYHEQDKDLGEEIWYCGTESKTTGGTAEVTRNTKHMLDSINSKEPVRVLRSANLPNDNTYKPVKGFRYDGLYEVLPDYKIIDARKQHHLFHLRRLPGQMGLRYEGIGARPTQREIEVYDEEMKKYGWKGGVP